MDDSTPQTLYRFYDAVGELLYIGVTGNLPARLEQHSRDKPWWREVDKVLLHHSEGRAEALRHERYLIERQRPKWNVQHSIGHRSWVQTQKDWPEVGITAQKVRALVPSPDFCTMDLWMEIADRFRDLPDDVTRFAQTHLAALSPPCSQDPCPICGEGEE